MPRSADGRPRSRSPSHKSKKRSGGFQWKEKPRRDNDSTDHRSYRDREYNDTSRSEAKSSKSSKPSKKERRDEAEDDNAVAEPMPSRDASTRNAHGSSNTQDLTPSQIPRDDLDIASKFGASAAAKFASKPADASESNPMSSSTAHGTTHYDAERQPKEPKAKDKARKSKAPAPPSQPMIIVTINDRLGTKAQIPCLPSDPVGLFKMQVAARIGRKPHEILLKRQGERPFKDALTLEDYGVSNGVQLDLELDTGD